MSARLLLRRWRGRRGRWDYWGQGRRRRRRCWQEGPRGVARKQLFWERFFLGRRRFVHGAPNSLQFKLLAPNLVHPAREGGFTSDPEQFVRNGPGVFFRDARQNTRRRTNRSSLYGRRNESHRWCAQTGSSSGKQEMARMLSKMARRANDALSAPSRSSCRQRRLMAGHCSAGGTTDYALPGPRTLGAQID